MFTLLEKYNSAKQAIHPDKLLIAGAIATFSLPVLVPLQSFLTFLVHESGEKLSTEWIQILAVAIIGLANVASIVVETKTLEKKLYSASPMSTALKVFIKNSLGIATAGHAINFAQIYLANPVQILNFITLQTGGGSRLFFENAIGVTLALSAWKLIFNSLILQVDISVLRESTKGIFKKLRMKKNLDTVGNSADYHENYL